MISGAMEMQIPSMAKKSTQTMASPPMITPSPFHATLPRFLQEKLSDKRTCAPMYFGTHAIRNEGNLTHLFGERCQ
jgi:hypothetical protein